MRSSTATTTRERARPLLGTIVRIRVAETVGADTAIDAAFNEIATVHRLMSAQEETSDLARIASAAPGVTIPVDWRTRLCLAAAADWSRRSGGAFDAVAAAGSDARWTDLVLAGETVSCKRPLQVDLSGIAKGFAVDRACATLAEHGIEKAVVEAGGDLKVIGDDMEPVALRPAGLALPAMVTIADGALASSDPAMGRAEAGRPVHIDGRTRRVLPDRFVAVVAPDCIDADALTKVVLAEGQEAEPLLRQTAAVAYLHDGSTWSVLGATA